MLPQQNRISFLILTTLILLTFSCHNKTDVKTLDDYNHWLNNPENGLLKIKKVNGVEIKVKILPANYLALKEYNDLLLKEPGQLDSLVSSNQKNLTILVSLSPDQEKGNHELMKSGLKSEEEYLSKIHAVNFNMDKYAKLKIGDKEYRPALSTAENNDGLTQSLNILYVFSGTDFSNDDVDFLYSDELFHLGMNHFLFAKEDLKNTPEIKEVNN